MLVVRLEVWPGGNEQAAYEIDRLDVGNVSQLSEDSEYVYRFSGEGFDDNETVKHKRSKGAWELVRKILQREKDHLPVGAMVTLGAMVTQASVLRLAMAQAAEGEVA